MYRDFSAQLRGLGSAGLDFLTEFVFPPTCAGCNCAGSWMCEFCSERLVVIGQPGTVSGNSEPGFESSQLARFAYVEPLRRAIHLLKYERQRARAEWFAAELRHTIEPLREASTVLQPIPLTARRQRARGFNQSTEIALQVGRLTGTPMVESLARVRETQPQVELSGLERVANVRGAFEATKQFAGLRVILIDDVITTGSTMRECAIACYEAGAEYVVGVAVARGL